MHVCVYVCDAFLFHITVLRIRTINGGAYLEAQRWNQHDAMRCDAGVRCLILFFLMDMGHFACSELRPSPQGELCLSKRDLTLVYY
jgi:hypothetical protein